MSNFVSYPRGYEASAESEEVKSERPAEVRAKIAEQHVDLVRINEVQCDSVNYTDVLYQFPLDTHETHSVCYDLTVSNGERSQTFEKNTTLDGQGTFVVKLPPFTSAFCVRASIVLEKSKERYAVQVLGTAFYSASTVSSELPPLRLILSGPDSVPSYRVLGPSIAAYLGPQGPYALPYSAQIKCFEFRAAYAVSQKRSYCRFSLRASTSAYTDSAHIFTITDTSIKQEGDEDEKQDSAVFTGNQLANDIVWPFVVDNQMSVLKSICLEAKVSNAYSSGEASPLRTCAAIQVAKCEISAQPLVAMLVEELRLETGNLRKVELGFSRLGLAYVESESESIREIVYFSSSLNQVFWQGEVTLLDFPASSGGHLVFVGSDGFLSSAWETLRSARYNAHFLEAPSTLFENFSFHPTRITGTWEKQEETVRLRIQVQFDISFVMPHCVLHAKVDEDDAHAITITANLHIGDLDLRASASAIESADLSKD